MNLVQVPFAELNLSRNQGTKRAPEAIANSLKKFYTTEDGLLPSFQLQKIHLNPDNVQASINSIENQSKAFFQNHISGARGSASEHSEKTDHSEKNLFLGGDHSITYLLVKAFAQVQQNPGIIIFDAHPDCQSDISPLTHEDLLLALLNNRTLRPESIVLVGLRNASPEEQHFLKQHQIKIFPMKEIAREGIYETSEAIMSIARNFGSLYLSIDIDVLDPAFAPGTACPEPGGLTTRELLFFLHRLKRLKNFKAADLVEINPEIDKNTALVGAKIAAELF